MVTPMTSRSSTTTERRAARSVKRLRPVPPGEVLLEEFLKPLGVSQYRLAKDTSVPPRRINEIVQGKRAVTADTALRLARYFGTSERFWLNLQTRYELEVAKDRLGDRLAREVRALAETG
jgi:addiction module HigA family antidote